MSGKRVEIDESQFLAQQKLAGLFEQMNVNPKAREKLYQAIKEVNPNVATPELDAKNEVYGEIAKRDEKLAALEAQIAEDRAARETERQQREFLESWNGKIAGLRRQGYTDEGIEKIQKLAEERGLVDLDAAAALFDKMNPPATVSQPGGGIGGLDLFQQSSQDDEDFKKLLEAQGEDPAAERALINKALTDYRSGRV